MNLDGVVTIDASKEQEHRLDELKKAVVDKAVPDAKVYAFCDAWFESWKEPGLDYANFQSIEELMAKNRDPYFAPLAKGRYFIESAWEWRGGSYADKVTVLQWSKFSEKLQKAEESLNEAWALDAKQPMIAEEMLCVELGQGKGLDRMELWFQRAMNLNTNDACACERKLLYLEPKWYGSDKEMFAFGRDCLESTNWGGKVPLIIVSAHRAHVNYLPANSRVAYWRQLDVWLDVQRAFNKYFQSHPNDEAEHQRYALFAYTAQQWDVFNEQIPLLGKVNYNLFGGLPAYNNMVGQARQHASKSK